MGTLSSLSVYLKAVQISWMIPVLPFKGINDGERVEGFLFRNKITPWQYSAETSTHYWIIQVSTVSAFILQQMSPRCFPQWQSLWKCSLRLEWDLLPKKLRECGIHFPGEPNSWHFHFFLQNCVKAVGFNQGFSPHTHEFVKSKISSLSAILVLYPPLSRITENGPGWSPTKPWLN